jgi:beta-phosphoglucomutase-like phosphatase (HAD superfamily)
MRALIFDLDGTLVDTVYAHVFAWQRAFAEAGGRSQCGATSSKVALSVIIGPARYWPARRCSSKRPGVTEAGRSLEHHCYGYVIQRYKSEQAVAALFW